MAPTPEGASLGGKGACDILRSLHLAAVENPIDRAVLAAEALEEAGDAGAGAPAGSRKDKSLGLLCDNFIHHFARSDSDLIELEAVAPVLGVGRRRAAFCDAAHGRCAEQLACSRAARHLCG